MSSLTTAAAAACATRTRVYKLIITLHVCARDTLERMHTNCVSMYSLYGGKSGVCVCVFMHKELRAAARLCLRARPTGDLLYCYAFITQTVAGGTHKKWS
jgi:hypothetical protein